MGLITGGHRLAAIATPGVAMPLAPPPQASLHLSPRDILTTLFVRKWLVLLAFLLPVVAGALAAALIRPRWPAEGLLLVQVSRETAGAQDLTGNGPAIVSIEMPKVVQSEVELLLSDVVLRRALDTDAGRALFPEAPAPRLFGLLPAAPRTLAGDAQQLRQALLVLSSNTSNLVRVSASLDLPEQSAAAVQAVFAAYLAHRQSIFTPADAELLSAETTRMAASLRELDAQIAELRTGAHVLDLPQDIQAANARIAGVTTRRDALRERRAATEAQLQAARARLAAYPARVVATSETTNLAPNDDSRNELTRLLLERRRMAAQYAADWPPLRELEARITTLQQAIARNRGNRFETVREVRNPAVEQLSLQVASLEVEAASTGQQMQELDSQQGDAEARAAVLMRVESQLRDLGRRREAMETSFRQVAGRETGARITEDARRSRSPSVIVAQAPEPAARPRDLRAAFVIAGLFCGVVTAAAATVLLALFRRSFATSDEAARGLGLPGLAGVPRGAKLADGETIPQLTDLAALLLDVRAGGDRLSLLQFVATGADDGRSAVALSVAVEIARVRGLRTLLVDLETDGRGFLTAMGSSPVHETQDPEQLLAFNTVVPQLWVAYAARQSLLGDPHAGIERTMALLDRLRKDLDVVVLVAPTDAQGYAMRRLTALMDANVLVLRAERTDKGVARAARDAVLGAGGRLAGFVMSGERRVLPARLARMFG